MSRRENNFYLMPLAKLEYIAIGTGDNVVLAEYRQICTCYIHPNAVSFVIKHFIPHLVILCFQRWNRIGVAMYSVKIAIAVAVIGVGMSVDNDQGFVLG